MGWRRDRHRQSVRLPHHEAEGPLRRSAAGVDIVGDSNDQAIRDATTGAMHTVAAWRAHGRLLDRGVMTRASSTSRSA